MKRKSSFFMFNIYIPTRNDYKEIIHLVNEADRVFCDIYTKSEANEVGFGYFWLGKKFGRRQGRGSV